MMMLFDDDYILKTYIESEKREAAKKAAQKADRKAAQNFYKLGISIPDIAKALEVSAQQVEKWLGLTKV